MPRNKAEAPTARAGAESLRLLESAPRPPLSSSHRMPSPGLRGFPAHPRQSPGSPAGPHSLKPSPGLGLGRPCSCPHSEREEAFASTPSPRKRARWSACPSGSGIRLRFQPPKKAAGRRGPGSWPVFQELQETALSQQVPLPSTPLLGGEGHPCSSAQLKTVRPCW